MKYQMILILALFFHVLFPAEQERPARLITNLKKTADLKRESPKIRCSYIHYPVTPGTSSPTTLFNLDFQLQEDGKVIVTLEPLDNDAENIDVTGNQLFDNINKPENLKALENANHIFCYAILTQKIRESVKYSGNIFFCDHNAIRSIKDRIERYQHNSKTADLVNACDYLLKDTKKNEWHAIEVMLCKKYIKPMELHLKNYGLFADINAQKE